MFNENYICFLIVHQGFSRTASTFAIEGKHVLQSISVHGPIRSLSNILSDYAVLKEKEIQKTKIQQTFFNDSENERVFSDIWDQFRSLLDDYKYYRNIQQSNEYISSQHNRHKRRRLNHICNDTHQRNEEQMLFELNTNRFNEILHNSQLHEKMAQLIQKQYDIESSNKKQKPIQKKPEEIVDSMMAMDESQFEELFVPLPLDQYENQKDADSNKGIDKSSCASGKETEHQQKHTNNQQEKTHSQNRDLCATDRQHSKPT